MAVTPKRGLIAVEWAMMAYVLFTTIFIMVTFSRLAHPWQMLAFRTGAVALTLALWMLYRRRPGRFTMLLRVAGQMVLLSWWYPDTYEMNRIFLNLDHVFAGWEQSLFGFQPALEFCQTYTHPIISELLSMGYVSYYPLFVSLCSTISTATSSSDAPPSSSWARSSCSTSSSSSSLWQVPSSISGLWVPTR